jgi:outer membrane protein TolC
MMLAGLVLALAAGQAGGAAARGAAQTPQAQAQVAPAPGSPAAGTPVQQLPVLTLDDALREAEAKNLDLVAARARLQQSQELSRRVWSNYLPQLVAQASYTRNSTAAELPAGLIPGLPQDIVIQPFNQYTAQLQVSQAVIAPTLFPAIRNAYLTEEIAAVSTENARREILFGVAQLYYGAVALKQSLAVQRRLLETQQAHEKDARVRYQAGTTPKVALLRAEIDRAAAEQDVKRAENNVASAKISLATLLDRQPDFEVEVPGPPPAAGDPAGLEDAALRQRPDVEAARQTAELARRTKDAVYYQYLPSLGLTGAYRWANVSGFTAEKTSWLITLGLNWVLYDGGLRETELRENRARVLEAEANRRGAENRARDEVRRGQLDLESAIANRQKGEEQLSLARENARLVEASFKAGAATYLDVTDAQSALRNSELGFVADNLNADLSALRLLRAAGVFNPGR